MKPLLLTIEAFGPFAGQESVDFTALGSNPLFLINGATGAGKSTILDASVLHYMDRPPVRSAMVHRCAVTLLSQTS